MTVKSTVETNYIQKYIFQKNKIIFITNNIHISIKINNRKQMN